MTSDAKKIVYGVLIALQDDLTKQIMCIVDFLKEIFRDALISSIDKFQVLVYNKCNN